MFKKFSFNPEFSILRLIFLEGQPQNTENYRKIIIAM